MPAASPQDFVPISPNPYIVGNPVRDPTMFFGREAEFDFVRKRFLDTERGGLLVFCGERRSGKTSILFQIAERRLGQNFIPVFVDMQQMAVRSEAEFLARVSEEIVSALSTEGATVAAPSFDGNLEPSSVFRDFIKKVLKAFPDKKLVLMFDEYELFEDKIDAGVLSQQLLHMLSSLMETLSVYLVFSGSQHIEKRQREYWRILSRSLYRAVSFLRHSDALRLIHDPVEGRVTYEKGVGEAIYRLTAGQPFYTQALCQNLVDQLNEAHSNHATHEILEIVIKDIVNNAFPQMVFMWEGLEHDEKLVLALLGEALQDASATATASDLTKLVASRKYPLDLDEARTATALVGLFKQELLNQADTTPHAYSFRMDIWRHWVRVMHSTWQVMRELGIKRHKKRIPLAVPVLGGFALLVVLAMVVVPQFGPQLPVPTAPAPRPGSVPVKVSIPQDAQLAVNGFAVGGRGQPYDRRLVIGRTYWFQLSARGHADTTFRVTPAASDSLLQFRIAALRPVFGTLTVDTSPPRVPVFVDGERIGLSPVSVERRVGVYTIAAEDDDHVRKQTSVSVLADTTIGVLLEMDRKTVMLTITVTPTDAEIFIDGRRVGQGTVQRTVEVGARQLEARRDEYMSVDTVVTVRRSLAVPLELQPEPLGVLEVRSSRFFDWVTIDGRERMSTARKGERRLKPGKHTLEVKPPGVDSYRIEVEIRSGRRTIFDVDKRSVIDEGKR